jgi:lysophospholipase L1-like esterase
MIRYREVTCLALLGLHCLCVVAQPTSPTGLVESPCPAPQPVSPESQAVSEKFLAPGKFGAEFVQSMTKGPGAEAYVKAQRELGERDWPNLCRYKADNAALAGKPRPQVVLMGDSITENWALADPAFFTNGTVGRGISGQTTPQMLVRFYADVIALHPQVVHIMAGTNDIAGNTGATTVQDYKNNILAMLDLAQAHRIKVVVAGIPPSRELFWRGVDPRRLIGELNAWLKEVAEQRKLIFVDYGSVLADPNGGMKDALSNDGVHPNRTGYAQMKPLATNAIAQAMHR